MKRNKSEKVRTVVYDDLYNVKQDFKSPKWTEKFIGNTIPHLLIFFGVFIILYFVTGQRNDARKLNQTLTAHLSSVELTNQQLTDQYDILLAKEEKYHIHYLIGKYTVQQNTEITKDSLYKLLDECEMWYPDITFAQVILESSMGKRVPDGNSNNLIGMKFPTKRETTAYGKTESGYAKYKNWQLCVLDKVLWDYNAFGYKKPSREEYINKISCLYAEDPNYINKIENIIDRLYKK